MGLSKNSGLKEDVCDRVVYVVYQEIFQLSFVTHAKVTHFIFLEEFFDQ